MRDVSRCRHAGIVRPWYRIPHNKKLQNITRTGGVAAGAGSVHKASRVKAGAASCRDTKNSGTSARIGVGAFTRTSGAGIGCFGAGAFDSFMHGHFSTEAQQQDMSGLQPF